MKNINKIVLPAASLLLAAICGNALASGFQLIEQNASGLGNAYAGSAASAENASTIFYNPAGMTQLQAREFSGGLAAVQPSFKFSDNASVAGNFTTAGNGGDGGALGLIPNAYISWAVSKDLYLGLGIGAPFGLMTDYDDSWIGAAQSIKFDVKTLNINPSVAFRVNDRVSLGFGLDWQKLDAEYKRKAGTGAGFSSVTSVMKIDDDAWGWNAGALFKLSPATKLGVSYRSAIKYTLTGDVTLSSDGTTPGNTILGVLTTLGAASSVKADVKVPDTWVFSATHKLNAQWEMLGDLSRTGWASIPKIDVIRTSGKLDTNIAQTLETDFRNTWRAALGANYKLRDDLKLKFGVAYDQSPVKGAASRMVSLPDNNRTWLSLGAQWQQGKGSTLDVGLAYLYIKDPSIQNDQNTGEPIPRGLVDGTYSDSAWLLGAQYSMAF